MRRAEVLAVLAGLGVMGLTACASPPKSTGQAHVVVQSAEGVTLRYRLRADRAEAEDALTI